MITVKDIAKKTMSESKKASAKNDLFAFYIGRPLSYVLTIPFLYTNIKPNTITLFSVIPTAIGFIISCFADSKPGMILCWLMYFLWNLLDGVDGNVARYKQQFSKLGSVYDAMSGYLAAALTFFSTAIMAAHSNGLLLRNGLLNTDALIIIGGMSALFNMFPRLVMHKAITELGNKDDLSEVNDKKNYSIVKIIALNLKSAAGGAQVLMLVAIIAGITDIYSVCYLLFNTLVMLTSLKTILKEK
ncbi:MAG: CDP-alcohol phosphatidyltransferase family protein [Ruminococcus sp.]|nr:CDP-alcohol phosphatidyltransferase family protein [Ruminococcus sp.]